MLTSADPLTAHRNKSQSLQLNSARLMMGLIDGQDTIHDMKSLTSTVSSPADGRSSARKRSSDAEKSVNSSEDGKRKKKTAQSDDRWSKRFSWPDELHRDFVAAIFDVGLKHSSPSAIMEHMPKNELITTERIKSHLQKYRLHRLKSKKEFMGCYESSIEKFKSGTFDNDPQTLKSAEVAAHLSYNSITDSEEPEDLYRDTLLQGGVLQLPILTEDEKKSPVGASMGYMLGLFFSLKQQLYSLRSTEGSEPRQVSPSIKQQAPTEAGGQNASALKDSFFSSVASHDKTGVFHSSLLTVNPLEETNNMKREMQHHINFQNNLRRMKEQELTKCMIQNVDQTSLGQPSGSKVNSTSRYWSNANQQKDPSTQGNTAHDGRSFGDDSMILMKGESRDSAAVAEDLWNTEGVDEAFLFEFLKDDH